MNFPLIGVVQLDRWWSMALLGISLELVGLQQQQMEHGMNARQS